MARNIEIKARVADLFPLRRSSLALGARPGGVVRQIDRYFEIDGARRIKLREVDGAVFELVEYERPEADGVRTSDYRVTRFDAGDEALAGWRARAAIRTVVKRRELLLLTNVRIHLDEVEGLGTFLELEAVVGERHDEAACRDAVDRLLAAFGIEREALVRASYSDLVAGVGGG